MEGVEDSDSEGFPENAVAFKAAAGDNVEAEESNGTAGKKTKGRVKIKMEFIDNKLRRYTTFSKRKTGIMKKAYELSTLTGTQVMLLVASETGHVYTFATKKLQPMITSEEGKSLIQTCLNSPDPPASSKGQQSDQRMSATGFEEPDLTYTLPTAAAASAPPLPTAHNVGEGPSGQGVDVKLEYHASHSKNMPPLFPSMYEPRAYYLDQTSPATDPASPEDRRPPIHDNAPFYNGDRLRDASPDFDARRSRPRSPNDHPRPHFYQESRRSRSPYGNDSPKYHTITPRSADRRFGRDGPIRERSRSASPQRSRKYVGDHLSRHSSGSGNNNRHASPPHHYQHPSRHSSPPPSLHHYHHNLPPALPHHPSSSRALVPAAGRGASRSRSRSPVSPPLSGDGDSWHRSARRNHHQQSPPLNAVMTTVNSHNKIINSSYHPKSPRAGLNLLPDAVGSSGFISTSTLAMQLPNGALISPGTLPPGLAFAPVPRGHAYVKLPMGQGYVPVSSSNHSDSPGSRSPARSPASQQTSSEKDVATSSSSRQRNSRPDARDNRDRSMSPGWEDLDKESRTIEHSSDAPPTTSVVPPGYVLSSVPSNFLHPVIQLPTSSAGVKSATLVYPPASTMVSSETSSQPVSHLPDGAQYILNIPGLQNATTGVSQGETGPGPHFIAIQVPVAAQQAQKQQQPSKGPKMR